MLWNFESMKLELNLSEGDGFDPTKVFALALSLDGLTLATGDSKKNIKLWYQV